MASKLKLFIYIIIYIISMHDTYLAGFLITLALNVPFASNSFFFSDKKYIESSNYKKLRMQPCFFLFSTFLPPRPLNFFYPFLFLRQCDVGAYGAPKPGLLTPFYLKISSGWFSSRDQICISLTIQKALPVEVYFFQAAGRGIAAFSPLPLSAFYQSLSRLESK